MLRFSLLIFFTFMFEHAIASAAFSTWEVGMGYSQWNERMTLKQAGAETDGFANYAGPSLLLEKNWIRYRWQWGVTTSFSSGKAAAGGFTGNLSFDDGINRNWNSFAAIPFVHYRLSEGFMVGVGLSTRYRLVSWEPLDKTLTVVSRPPWVNCPQINFRLRLDRKISLTQSYVPLNSDGDILWIWAAQYIF